MRKKYCHNLQTPSRPNKSPKRHDNLTEAESCVRCTVALWKRMFCLEHGIAYVNAIALLTLKLKKILEVESQHNAASSLNLSRAEECPCGSGSVLAGTR